MNIQIDIIDELHWMYLYIYAHKHVIYFIYVFCIEIYGICFKTFLQNKIVNVIGFFAATHIHSYTYVFEECHATFGNHVQVKLIFDQGIISHER